MKPLVIPEDVKRLSCVNFNLNSGYEMGKGLAHDKTEKLFAEVKEKIYPIFREFGYRWKEPELSGGCPTMVNDGREVYVHPMELNVHARKEEAEALEKKLSEEKFDTFSYMGKFVVRTPVYECSLERAKEVYELNKDVMKENVVELLEYGPTSESEVWQQIHYSNNLATTGENNFFGYSSSDLCSKYFDKCIDEMEKDRLVERDDFKLRKCRVRKEPYITVVYVKDGERKNGHPSRSRYMANVKTRDCIPVARLCFYPDGKDLKVSSWFHDKENAYVGKILKAFVKKNKKDVVELGKLVGTATRFEKKQKEFAKKWESYYLENTANLAL